MVLTAPPKPPRSADPYRVMLVDDSAVIRGLFARSLESDPEVQVVASVGDGQMAVNTLGKDKGKIEVIVLDIEMPRMDGLTALPELLKIDPDVPVVMASTLTARNADISLKALALGAKDYIPKPSSMRELSAAETFKRELLEKVKTLAAARRRRAGASAPARPRFTADRAAPTAARPAAAAPAAKPAAPAIELRPAGRRPPQVLCIGSSTGGPQALFKMLGALPKTLRLPILLTQHMPATFTSILADHITRSTGWECVEATDGMPVQSGRVHLAPGDFHMLAERSGTGVVLRLNKGAPENFCRPAVDPMLRSVVEAWGGQALTVILTGMGHDGQKGSEVLVNAGGTVIAQDEASSVVWGMPGAVARAGICTAVLPLDQIASWIDRQTSRWAA
ncbi:chemotaxis response regulator protein-glutamate methylesterase [Thalassobaculum sp. OXR-137]|uniref:protein-glutamate methylesterase/protein-glutamine glutaminase n=1 Tax=Thalassobaculum sp. OXR-137 TaxID=3100173 RepID=UPI002AC919B3|nr:chemotaxis response regulator protein-glutamate methylesterase [Thalassobaculum sp. OXR-137]WPZ32609.1 chemotaxis response regulator protein-glutamate methylesterase [Thalassobaculum sp. OXR-137]